MSNKHKHAEVIKAWADGAEIEVRKIDSNVWVDARNTPLWCSTHEYRVKPKPHIHQALKDAHAKGAVIQYYNKKGKFWVVTCANSPNWCEHVEYRVKPKTYKLQLELTEAEAFVLACKINNYYIRVSSAPIHMEKLDPKCNIRKISHDLYRKFDFKAMAAAFE